MSEEASNNPTSSNLFDDSDDSDEDMAPSTQPTQPSQESSNAKADNSRLFGSDDDDSDDDEAQPSASAPAAVNQSEENAADADATDKDNDASEEKKANNSDGDDSDADVEFDDDGKITGKKAPVRRISTMAETAENQNSDGPPQRIIVPDLPLPQVNSKGLSLHMAKLPKIVAIQPEAYSRDRYNASVEDAEFKGTVHSMIRWRYKTDEDGELIRDENKKLVKESNARIIKWSDGTYGLRVGDEVFDMDEFSFQINKPSKNGKDKKGKTANNGMQTKPNCKDFLYLTKQAQIQGEDDDELKPVGTILECISSLQSKFIPRPASLKSAAHENFVLKERKRVIKRAQIQEFVTFVDPEKQKAERIRNKDDLMKQERRSGGRRSTGGGGGRRRYGMHRAYMDEDDEHYDTVNIRKLKRRTRDGDDMDYGDDDYMSEEEDEWSKRKKRGFESGRKTKQYQSDEEEEEEEEELVLDDDDEEEEVMNRKNSRAAAQKRKASMFDDDDESD